MARHNKKQKGSAKNAAPPPETVRSASLQIKEEPPAVGSKPGKDPWRLALPLLVAAIAFLAYWPSLGNDFIYDGALEIKEGFFTNIANLPDVLTLKVLHMKLLLADRPGQLLYLMLLASVFGTNPFGYHICSNLLHAANAALVVVLLRRFSAMKAGDGLKTNLALLAAVLIFVLHPMAVEPVSAINFSSDLLATFFTLLGLFAASSFDPVHHPRQAKLYGIAAVVCSFAAICSKESGFACCLLLIVYWFIYRRHEVRKPWYYVLGGSVLVTAGFLVARGVLALPPPNPEGLGYPHGTIFGLAIEQPRLWVFMMGKIIWPATLSGDYRLPDIADLSAAVAIPILLVVLLGQLWLALRSNVAAMGVAIFWFGLATVSNLVPLYRPLADRFYYMPMAGLSAQIFALLLMAAKSREGFWAALAPFYLALLPLTALTLARQQVFANDLTFWSDTAAATPSSWTAHYNLAGIYAQKNNVPAAISEYQLALALAPGDPGTMINLAEAYALKGDRDEEIPLLQKALTINPASAEGHNDFGDALTSKARIDEAVAQYREAIRLKPDYAEAYNNLGIAEVNLNQVDNAIRDFKMSLKVKPDYAQAHSNLGIALVKKGQMQNAIDEFRAAAKLSPNDANVQANLAEGLAQQAKAAAAKK